MRRRTLDQWDPAKRVYSHADESGVVQHAWLGAESYADFQVEGRDLGEVREICASVARGIGLVNQKSGSETLSFRDPFLPPIVPIQVAVTCTDRGGHVDISVAGVSGGGFAKSTPRYLQKLVRTFSDRVARETSFSWTPPKEQTRRRRARRLLVGLTWIQWVPVVMAIPIVVVVIVFWGGLWPVILLVSWAYLLLAVPPLVSVVRRRLVGLGALRDLVPWGTVTGVFGVGVTVWLVQGEASAVIWPHIRNLMDLF